MAKYTISKQFTNTLAALTESNAHTDCCWHIARWGRANAADKETKAWFFMFENIFNAMKNAHEDNGNFPYCELRYDVAREMEALIVKTYGQKALDILNAAM